MRSSSVEAIRSLISCGMQQRDAVAIVVDRHAMEGYMAQLTARCTTARVKATAAPEQPPPWLAEMNKTRNIRTGIEDGLLLLPQRRRGDREAAGVEPRAQL
jgi:hypothetical protein